MSKLKEIIKGWKNYKFPNPEYEAMAAKKAKVCSSCDSAIQDTWFDLVDKKIEELSGLACDECSCPLTTLLRSDKPCPLNKFE